MLKNIPPLITPDALFALASMGHGDELAIVDANFPAARVAAARGARLVRLAGADAPTVLRAVLTLLPLDDFGAEAVWTMQVVGDAAAVPAPVAELRSVLREGGEAEPASLERLAFYERASAACLILQTGERRRYGNLILRTGVVDT